MAETLGIDAKIDLSTLYRAYASKNAPRLLENVRIWNAHCFL